MSAVKPGEYVESLQARIAVLTAERDTARAEAEAARAFHEVECQRTVEAVERMIAAERSESALQAAVARAVALLERWYAARYVPDKGGSRAVRVADTRATLEVLR